MDNHHDKLRFMLYWLMSIVNMVQDKTEEKRIFFGVGMLICVLTFLFVFKSKNRSKPSRMKAVGFPIMG